MSSSGGQRRRQRRHGFLILVLALVCGLALRIGIVSGRETLSFDGTFSYLEAAGHEGDFEEVTAAGSEQPPYGEWVSARRWQQFLIAEAPFRPLEMARHLATLNIHLPLYFWLLHVSSRILGMHVWTGLALNVVIDLLTILVIFGAGRAVFKAPRWAALAALVWAVSPAPLEATRMARQYALLALVSILFAWQFVRIIRSGRAARWSHYLSLTCVVFAGALTHSFFAVCVMAALLVGIQQRHREVLGRVLVSTAAGVIPAIAVDPWFARLALQGNPNPVTPTLARLQTRILKVGFHLFDLVGNTMVGNVVLALAVSAWAVVVVYRHPRGKRLKTLARKIRGPDRNPFMLLALLVYFTLGALFIAFVLPYHATGPRYLAAVWPLMAIGVVASLRQLRCRRWLVPALLVFALTNSMWQIVTFHREHAEYQALANRMHRYDYLLVDQLRSGTFLALMHEVDPDTRVYAARPEDILEHVSDWEPRLREAPGRKAYASNVFLTTTREDRAAILDLLREHGWEVPDEAIASLPTWRVYELERY